MLAQSLEVAKGKVGTEKVANTHFNIYSTNTVEPKAIKLGIKTLEEAEKILSLVPAERKAVMVKVETKIRNIRKALE